MKNKKTMITVISIVALLLVLIGITYAYWLVTKTQTNQNIISSACLDITLDNESNDISLSSQYPMSDEDGMKLTPYTFTVTNNCNTSIDYQVALESVGEEATAINASALQVALDTNANLLSNRATVATTVSGAYVAHRLGYGTLAARENEGSSVSHSLRIWIDENAPISEANKTFRSKITVTIGQGIKSPTIKEGTLAYDILANNDEATTLSATWETEILEETDFEISLDTYYWFGTSYEFDEETGEYQLSGELVQATLEECRDKSVECGNYTFGDSDVTENYSTKKLYKVISFTGNIEDNDENLYMTTQEMISKNIFSTEPIENDAGLYMAQDDLGESYYFRGDVTNNYVQFGSYAANSEVNGTTYTTETPMYWRIVRINGDGTIRLVYDGTTKVENGTNHRANVGMTTYNGNDYLNVNYGDSDIKGVVDTWYNTHLKTNYGEFIADGIFCNDKEVTEANYYDDGREETTKENAYYTDEYYAPYDRLRNKKAPILTCTRTEDRYTTKTTLGNGLLSNPVGLLTADELLFAGGTNKGNYATYLFSGVNYWTSTPSYSSESDDYAYVWVADDNDEDDYSFIDSHYHARPVINLRADVEFTGNGSFETPYVIKTN